MSGYCKKGRFFRKSKITSGIASKRDAALGHKLYNSIDKGKVNEEVNEEEITLYKQSFISFIDNPISELDSLNDFVSPRSQLSNSKIMSFKARINCKADSRSP